MSYRAPRPPPAAPAGVIAAVSGPLPAGAQNAGNSQSLFRQIVPHPSGKNGYEDLIQACDCLRSSGAFERTTEPDLSLSEARAILADRRVSEALTIHKAGLAKPNVSPRRAGAAAAPEGAAP